MPQAAAGNVISSSNQLNADVVLSSKIKDGEIVNADISPSAAIVYSKLNIAGSVVDADLSSANTAVRQSGAQVSAADTGSANAYAIAPSPAIGAYTTGMYFRFVAANSNTAASTLAVSGLAAKNILKLGSTSLSSGDIVAGQAVEVMYDGTQFQMTSIAPATVLPKVIMGTSYDIAAQLSADSTNGSNTINANGYSAATSASAGGYAREGYDFGGGTNVNLFAAGGVLSGNLQITTLGTTAAIVQAAGIPVVSSSGITMSPNHIGVKVDIAGSVATLSATVGDGTETAASLGTIVVNDFVEWFAVIVSTSLVNFYWRKNGGALSSAVPITTHIPTALAVSSIAGVSNKNTASNTVVNFRSLFFQR